METKSVQRGGILAWDEWLRIGPNNEIPYQKFPVQYWRGIDGEQN